MPDPIPTHPGVELLGERRVWSGRYQLDLIDFRHRRFDGTPSEIRTWELFRRGRAAAVLPYDPWRDQVVLIEQFRLPALAAGVDPVMVEIPAGMCDAGEDPAETVRREAVEEMGQPIDKLAPIGSFVLSPGGCDERCTMFAGRIRAPEAGPEGHHGIGGLAEEHEDIRVHAWPADLAIDAALGGQFANAVTTLTLLWLAARRATLRAEWTAQ